MDHRSCGQHELHGLRKEHHRRWGGPMIGKAGLLGSSTSLRKLGTGAAERHHRCCIVAESPHSCAWIPPLAHMISCFCSQVKAKVVTEAMEQAAG